MTMSCWEKPTWGSGVHILWHKHDSIMPALCQYYEIMWHCQVLIVWKLKGQWVGSSEGLHSQRQWYYFSHTCGCTILLYRAICSWFAFHDAHHLLLLSISCLWMLRLNWTHWLTFIKSVIYTPLVYMYLHVCVRVCVLCIFRWRRWSTAWNRCSRAPRPFPRQTLLTLSFSRSLGRGHLEK